MHVKIVCTTDDPTDSLTFHTLIQQDSTFPIQVLPTFRPDKAIAVEDPMLFNKWVDDLETVSKTKISDYHSFIQALQLRHDDFHQVGCRISDHGLEYPVAAEFQKDEIEHTFLHIRAGDHLEEVQKLRFKTAVMIEFGKMAAQKKWTMQLHFGAIRNTNSRMQTSLGPDTGFDSMGDHPIAQPLAKFLDMLNRDHLLPKIILYSVNPKDYEVLSTMTGNFQDGSFPGKIQHGSAWWFNDQKTGIEHHLISIANHGLLSRFVGMLTDSRSFLSFPRHEYFRRILCNLIGTWAEKGEIPNEIEELGQLVQNISFENAKKYFGIEID